VSEDSNGNEIIESAKAVQEAAKASGKVIDSATEIGAFLNKVFGGTVVDLGGLVGDPIRVFRQKRYLELVHKTNAELEEKGIEYTVPVPAAIAVPLLEKATLQDDPIISDLWAKLLANAMDPNCSDRVDQSHSDQLGQLSRADVILLLILRLHAKLTSLENPILTSDDPEVHQAYEAKVQGFNEEKAHLKSEYWNEFGVHIQKRAIHNLIRMRLAAFERQKVDAGSVLEREYHHFQDRPPTVSINPDQFMQLVNRLDMNDTRGSGVIEPDVFQVWDGDPNLRYEHPERGMHLVASGTFLMDACEGTSSFTSA